MPEIKIPWFSRWRGLFKPALKPYLVDEKYKVIPAFSIGGTDYWMYDSAMEVPTGRFFAAMGIYTEMEMNCSKDYLLSHCKAMEKLLSDPKKIQLTYIMQLNVNLRERLDLMPMPEFIYKLASVIFFDKSESLYSYDYDYNKLKIEKWKAAGGTLDFFFKDAVKRIGAVTDYARKRYPDLFDGKQNGRRNAPSASFRYIVGKNLEDREKQLCSLADYEPVKIEQFYRIPIIDYYMILNSRVQDAMKSNKK